MDLPQLNITTIVYFLAFVVPGFISMQVYVQIRPRQRSSLKDSLLEAVTFGGINLVLLYFPIAWVADRKNFDEHPFSVWLLWIVLFFICPLIWPILLVKAQNLLAKWDLFLATSPTAWDHYFGRKRGCWVLVHLNENRRVGGWFGTQSFASAYPDPGHLYIEELWELDEHGGFKQKQPQSLGILLRPADYQLVEFFDTK